MHIISLIANLVFYLAFPIMDGPIWCKDSGGYVAMDTFREPLYPLFLKFFRDIFGESSYYHDQPFYLFVAVLVQSALAALAVWQFGKFMTSFGKTRRQKLILECGGILSMWGVQLLNRFAAQRASAYPECIMTEGLGISLWLFFMIFAFQYFRDHKRKDLILAGIFMLLCMSLRKQLMVSVLTFGAMALLYELFYRKKVRIFLACVVTCILSFIGSNLFDYSYNYALRGIWMQHTGNSMGIDCVLLYTTTSEDASLIEDPNLRELFLTIQSEMEELQIRYVDNEENASWPEIAEHFALAYDVIGYEIMNPALSDYIDLHMPEMEHGTPQYYMLVDEIEGQLRNDLLHQDLRPIIKVFFCNLAEALVNTVLRMNTIFILASAVLYALYLAFQIVLGRQIKKEHSPEVKSLKANALLFSVYCMIGILINCAVVSVIIFPQTRYMIYNMGLFYAAGIVMMLAVFSL